MTPAMFAQTVGMQLSADDAAVILASLAEAGYEIRRKPAPRGSADGEPAGQRFEAAHLAAKLAATAELGPSWHLVPGASQWITLPPRLAAFKFRRSDGTLSVPIRCPRDHRAPHPRYWPGGTLPAGVDTEGSVERAALPAERAL